MTGGAEVSLARRRFCVSPWTGGNLPLTGQALEWLFCAQIMKGVDLMKKRMIVPVFLLLLIVGALTLTASAADIVDSGDCGADGDNVTWSLDSDGILSIFGIGKMKSFDYARSIWYSYKNEIKRVEIHDGVTGIGDCAFQYCYSLTSIIIPNSITSIGQDAFDSCTSLTSVVIPDSVTSIGNYAFEHCTNLTNVTIPHSVTSIGRGTFSRCRGLTSITIPNSVTVIGGDDNIGNGAFEDCSGLKSITIPNSVTSIEYRAFYGCSGVEYLLRTL